MKLSASTSTIMMVLASISNTNAQPGRGNHNRPFGGGESGDRPGFPGLQPDFVTKTCDAQWECPLQGRDAQETTGIFVCRQTYHPIFGTLQARAKCISPQEAYETDECGCCGDDECPSIPSVQTLTCDDTPPSDNGLIPDDAPSANDDAQDRRRGLGKKRGGGGGGPGGNRGGNRLPEDAAIVCRQLYNPYTGIQERLSMYIDPEKSLDGDVCGCCDGICPEDLDRRGPKFSRPDHVELTWCEANTGGAVTTGNEYVSCTLPPRDHGDEAVDGVFVCRSMANILTGVAESQALCISPDRAWETDQCGCCGQDCPEQPLPVDLECTVGTTDANGNEVPTETITQECQLRNGDVGFFACRSLFHPLDGSVIQRTLCLKDEDEDGDNAWTTDQCGCCGSSCPSTPDGGFPSVDRQMMELSLEGDGFNSDFGGELRAEEALANESSNSGILLGLLLLALIALVVMAVRRYAHSRADASRK